MRGQQLGHFVHLFVPLVVGSVLQPCDTEAAGSNPGCIRIEQQQKRKAPS